TSLPIFAATSASRSLGQFNCQARFAATIAAAASLEPPPRPAVAGIRFTSSIVAPRLTPPSLRSNSIARQTRFFGPAGISPYIDSLAEAVRAAARSTATAPAAQRQLSV